MLKIGILREEKVPHDRRVAFTPEQCKHIESTFNVKIIVQPSDWRVIKDSQYTAAGITLRDNLTDC
ncbi:MAG TPA: alanine dehydrogenase, partial [Bacteroidia bacterium]|nr:alanine dehydrogenase [Bacteroidia bacterium]